MNVKRLILAIFLLFIFKTSAVAQAPAPTPAPELKTYSLPTFGIGLQLPIQWNRALAHDGFDVARWLVRDEKTKQLQQLILVEMEPTEKNADLKVAALHLAENDDAKLNVDAFTLVGMPAYRIIYGPVERMNYVQGIIVKRDDCRYIIHVFAVEQTKGAATMAMLQRNWQWIPFESPASHLSFSIVPFRLFDEHLILQAPAIMRLTALKENRADLVICDNRNGMLGTLLQLELQPREHGVSMAAHVKQLAIPIQKKLNLTHPLTFHEIAGQPGRFLSEPYTPAMTLDTSVGDKMLCMVGLLPVSADRLLLFNFRFIASTQVECKAYSQAAGKMFALARWIEPRKAVTGKQ